MFPCLAVKIQFISFYRLLRWSCQCFYVALASQQSVALMLSIIIQGMQFWILVSFTWIFHILPHEVDMDVFWDKRSWKWLSCLCNLLSHYLLQHAGVSQRACICQSYIRKVELKFPLQGKSQLCLALLCFAQNDPHRSPVEEVNCKEKKFKTWKVVIIFCVATRQQAGLCSVDFRLWKWRCNFFRNCYLYRPTWRCVQEGGNIG
jgi:hypothetical protein